MTSTDGSQEFRLGLLGHGTVGGAFDELLAARAGSVAAITGRRPAISGVLTRSQGDGEAIVDGADAVVELMGGIEPARTLVLRALRAGTPVVTANKQLLSRHGEELWDAAREAGVQLRFEAAVAGVVPVVRVLADSLAGARVDRLHGIVNGTANFILSEMAGAGDGPGEGVGYAEALREAQRLGYAEADPTADVAGLDAAAKAAILASLAFHTRVTLADVYCEGIENVTSDDVASARAMGYVIKLLAIADLTPDGAGICVRVHPTMVPRTHPLAAVRGAFNAVFVEAEAAGQVMFYGQGAGGEPTASAVLGDLVTAARHRVTGSLGAAASTYNDVAILPVDDAVTSYYVDFHVQDRSGVLAEIARLFAEHGVSISGVRQEGRGDEASLIIRTHEATDSDLRATIDAVADLDSVRRVAGVMRVIGE